MQGAVTVNDERRLKELLSKKAQWLKEEQLRFYKPHPQQLAFHKSQAEKRGLFGGNQSGKSYSGGMDFAWTVGKVHPFRPNYRSAVYGRDCCKSNQVLNAVLIPTYKSILPRKPCKLSGLRYENDGVWVEIPDVTFEGKPRIWPGLKGGSWDTAYDKIYKILYLEDGSLIEFKTYEQDVDSFAGPPRHIIRHDEEPPQAHYNENQARQVTVGVNMLFTMTPLNYSQWLYADIYEKALVDKKIEVFKMASRENPFADVNVLDAMERDITDPAERAARLYGDFTYLEGRVYKAYGEHNFIEPFIIPERWHHSIVIDPHPSKPTAVNWFAENEDGRVFCYREADIKGDIEHVCNEISNLSAHENIDLMLIDPAAKGQKYEWGKGSILDEFRKHFPYLVEANNNRELGWDVVGRYVKQADKLKGARFLVFKSCPITHHQMKNYSWKPPTKTGEDRNKQDVVKRDDDHPDCVRYRLMWKKPNNRSGFSGFNIGVYGS